MQQQLKNSIHSFSSISLEEMNDVALMKRTDTKFVVHISQLLQVLEQLSSNYKVLEIKGDRLMTYSSLYFDTGTNKFYNDHHNGKVNRTKIRIRKYIESNLCFLEIKQKDGKGNTNKSRIKIGDFESKLSDSSEAFIKTTTLQEYQLYPTLWNGFNRVTLVNIESKERVTIDLNLSFSKDKLEKKYEDLVIIELKQERFNRNSPIVKVLKSLQNHPYSISKYCIGMVSLYSDIKYNIFKNKLIKINKLSA